MERRSMSQIQRTDRVDDMYKIVLVGDMSCGKTAILQKFTESPDFPQMQMNSMPTIGIDFKLGQLFLMESGLNYKYGILLEVRGLGRFVYYRNALGCILVYDITNRQSFTNVQYWLQAFQEQTQNDIPVILLGNKVDVTQVGARNVSRASAEKLSIKLGIRFLEVSAKTGENIETAFIDLSRDIKEQRDKKFRGKQTASETKKIKIRPTTTNPRNSPMSKWFSKMKCSIL